MAITWEVKITPINIDKYVASIRATRIDDAEPDNPMVYEIPRAVIETTPQQAAVMDEIWAKHQAALANKAKIDAFVAAKEAAGKANLEARE